MIRACRFRLIGVYKRIIFRLHVTSDIVKIREGVDIREDVPEGRGKSLQQKGQAKDRMLQG